MPKQKNLIKLFASFIIALSLSLSAAAYDELVALGHTTGIKLHTEGAIVVGLSDMENNPCRSAGLTKGDIIKSIDGEKILSNSALKEKVESSDGREMRIEYMRGDETFTSTVTPVKNADGKFCIGVWIRDQIAGIGTLTFFDPDSGKYGALGHGICDSDTGVLVPVENGALMGSEVVGVKRGKEGEPGELEGKYDLNCDFADISKNSEGGIFGNIIDKNALKNAKMLPVATKDEIKREKATILSNIEGNTVSEYEIEIEEIYRDGADTKNLLIRVTDPRLLEKTGGIVRGMSGSPILQNGKLVGAVTHVLINDPTRGYGIFIENMLSEAEKIK